MAIAINKKRWQRNLWYLLFTFILIWPALHNMFPLVTPDTGTYIHSGLALSMPVDRPWGYGIFLLLSSMAVSPWFPIFWQGFFAAWLLIKLGTKCLARNMSWPFWAGIILIISFGTAIAWFNSQLMADAFTGLLLLAILLLYLKPETRRERNMLNAFVIFCLFTHHSHLLTTFLLCIILWFYFSRRKLSFEKWVSIKLILYSIGVAFIISTANFIGHYGFGLSPASHLFLMSRMAENGILDAYLKDKCPVESNVLCPYQGKTGARQWDFMWSAAELPHTKENGWEQSQAPYRKIIFGTLTSPKFLGMQIVKNSEAGLKQLTQLQFREGLEQTYPEGSSVHENIRKEFPSYLKEFETDYQNQNKLPFDISGVIIQIVSILLIIAGFWSRSYNLQHTNEKEKSNWNKLFLITVGFIIINAFLTATFSTVIGRLQARVFWVLPVICLFYFTKMLLTKYAGYFLVKYDDETVYSVKDV